MRRGEGERERGREGEEREGGREEERRGRREREGGRPFLPLVVDQSGS